LTGIHVGNFADIFPVGGRVFSRRFFERANMAAAAEEAEAVLAALLVARARRQRRRRILATLRHVLHGPDIFWERRAYVERLNFAEDATGEECWRDFRSAVATLSLLPSPDVWTQVPQS
jgi:hypothetical protein